MRPPFSDPVSDRQCSHLPQTSPALPSSIQSRHGPLQGHLSNIRPRAQEYARTHNGLYGPSGPRLWVGTLIRVSRSAARHPHVPKERRWMPRLPFPELLRVMLCCLVPLPRVCSLLLTLAYVIFVLFAAPNGATTPKSVSSASSNIISQVGTSNPRASRSRERASVYLHRASPSFTRSPLLTRSRFPGADTILSWANSSDAAMTTRMARRAFTLQSKVSRGHHCHHHPSFGSGVVIHISDLFFFCRSFTPSTHIRLLLRFAGEQNRHRR